MSVATKLIVRSALISATLLVGANRAHAVPILWSSAVGGNDHYYDISVPAVTWADALALADAATYDPGSGLLDGHLVTITSAAEDTFLSSTFGSTTTFWTAATDQATEGTWLWAAGPETGTQLSFFDWGAGEPNNSGNQDFVIANWFFTPGLWDDNFGTSQFRYVIEYSSRVVDPPPVPEPATLSLLGLGLAGAAVRRFKKRR